VVVVVGAWVVVVLDVVVDGGSMVDEVLVVGSGMHPPGVPIMGQSAFGTNVPGPPPHTSQVLWVTWGPLMQLPSGQLQQLGFGNVVVVAVLVVEAELVVVVGVPVVVEVEDNVVVVEAAIVVDVGAVLVVLGDSVVVVLG